MHFYQALHAGGSGADGPAYSRPEGELLGKESVTINRPLKGSLTLERLRTISMEARVKFPSHIWGWKERGNHATSGGRRVREEPSGETVKLKMWKGIQEVLSPETNGEENFRRERMTNTSKNLRSIAIAMMSLSPRALSRCQQNCPGAPCTWKKL